MSEIKRVIILIIAVLLIGGGIFYLESKKTTGQRLEKRVDVTTSKSMTTEDKAKKYQVAKELISPDGFINTDSITIQELIGKKVIIVDFWTYSCINCQRTMPYINEWYSKYRDEGLEIIGVHTPEFEFEKEYNNVQDAVDEFGIEYPVVLDNNYLTWSNYKNRYWPRKYIIDIDGYIVYDHIGEGGYEETEKVIQQLLKERKEKLDLDQEISSGIIEPENVQVVDVTKRRSPEIYFGASRNSYFGNGKQNMIGLQNLSEPSKIKDDTLYLVGDWKIEEEYATNQSNEAKIIFKYKGDKVFMVAKAQSPVKARLLIDGQPIGKFGGQDVVNGVVTFQKDRLYKVVDDPADYGTHTLEIIVQEAGLEVFTFTFG